MEENLKEELYLEHNGYIKDEIKDAKEGIEKLQKMHFDHKAQAPEILIFGVGQIEGVNEILGTLSQKLGKEEFGKKSSTGQFVRDCKKFENSERISLEGIKNMADLENKFDEIYDFLKSVKKYKKFFGSRINPLVNALDKLRMRYDKERSKASKYLGKNDKNKDIYSSDAIGKIYGLLKLAIQRLDDYRSKKTNQNFENGFVADESLMSFSSNMHTAYSALCRLAIIDSKKAEKRAKKAEKRAKNESGKTKTGLIPWYDKHKNATKVNKQLKVIVDLNKFLPKSFFKSSRLNKLKSEIKKLNDRKTLLDKIIEETEKAEQQPMF